MNRACAAIICDQSILMVHHQHDGRDYWTLPGGGVEIGETAEEAAIREVEEETGLQGIAIGMLYEEVGASGRESCFLVQAVGDQLPTLGTDPEQANLQPGDRMLRGVAWFPLTELGCDRQVSKVIAALDLP